MADSEKMLWSKFTTDFDGQLFDGGELASGGTRAAGDFVCVCQDNTDARRLRVFNTALPDTQPVLSVDDIHAGYVRCCLMIVAQAS